MLHDLNHRQLKYFLVNEKQHFDKYSYYQVINAYKNIFSTSIENIDDIENNIKKEYDIRIKYPNTNYKDLNIAINNIINKYEVDFKNNILNMNIGYYLYITYKDYY